MNRQLRDLLVGIFSAQDFERGEQEIGFQALADYCEEHQLLSGFVDQIFTGWPGAEETEIDREGSLVRQSEMLRDTNLFSRWRWHIARSLVLECDITAHRVFVRATTDGARHFLRDDWTEDEGLTHEDHDFAFAAGGEVFISTEQGRTRLELSTVLDGPQFVFHPNVYVAVDERPFLLDCDSWESHGTANIHRDIRSSADTEEVLTFLLAGR